MSQSLGEDYLPDIWFPTFKNIFEDEYMDAAYKKLGKEAKKIEKDTKKVLAKDEKRDSLVKAGKKAMKGKC